MGGACGTYWGSRSAYRILMGRPDGKRQLGRPRLDGRIILKWIFN